MEGKTEMKHILKFESSEIFEEQCTSIWLLLSAGERISIEALSVKIVMWGVCVSKCASIIYQHSCISSFYESSV